MIIYPSKYDDRIITNYVRLLCVWLGIPSNNISIRFIDNLYSSALGKQVKGSVGKSNRSNLYEMYISNQTKTTEDVLIIIAHELIHVMQMTLGQLVCLHDKIIWLDQDMTNVPYDEQPWEIEARNVSKSLFERFISELENIA